MAFLTVLNNRAQTPAAVLAAWMQFEIGKADLKTKRISVEADPYAAQQRIEQARRDGVQPRAEDVELVDYRGMFVKAVLDVIAEHRQAAKLSLGDPARHTDCAAAWRLAGKAAQVSMTLAEIGRFVEMAEKRSTALVKDARKMRRQHRRAA